MCIRDRFYYYVTFIDILLCVANKFDLIFLPITKTTEYELVVKADITLVRLLIDSEKLAQAVDEFTKLLEACTEAWGRYSDHSYSECKIRIFVDIIWYSVIFT